MKTLSWWTVFVVGLVLCVCRIVAFHSRTMIFYCTVVLPVEFLLYCGTTVVLVQSTRYCTVDNFVCQLPTKFDRERRPGKYPYLKSCSNCWILLQSSFGFLFWCMRLCFGPHTHPYCMPHHYDGCRSNSCSLA